MAFPHDGKKFQKGESGNPAGRPVGTKSLSTLIRELEDVDWELTSLKSKTELSQKYGKSGMRALVYVAFSKAMSGDVKAMEWLAKHGYGEKIKLEIDDPRREILAKYGLTSSNARQIEEAESRSSEASA